MTSKSEDKIFKNISNEDVRILLEIIDIDSVKVKIWTKELRLYDPKDYVPDIIMELDLENLIIELQSTPVCDDFSKRALTYVAVGTRVKDNDKPINLIVLSTAEESKVVTFEFSKDSVFTYRIISLKDMDADEIIKTVEMKIKNDLELTRSELIQYSLVPLMKDDDIENYITRVTHNLLQVKNAQDTTKNVALGITWMIVDKFIKDEQTRQILCDALGDRMTLIYEYADRKEKKGRIEGMKEIITSFLNAGDTLQEISQKTGKSISELDKILKTK